MIKKVSIFTTILFFSIMSTVFAHTGLKSSTPNNGDVVNTSLEQLTLTFDGKIEQGSTFTVQNASGTEITVTDISINENVMNGNLSSPLENREYTVNWSIIGEDGHIVEDSFEFKVDIPVTETTDEPTDTETTVNEENEADSSVVDENETEVQITSEQNTEETQVNQKNAPDNAEAIEDGNSNFLYILIGALIIIIIISIIFLAKRKR